MRMLILTYFDEFSKHVHYPMVTKRLEQKRSIEEYVCVIQNLKK